MSKETMDPTMDASRRDFLRMGGMTAIALGVTDLYAEAPKTHAETMIGVPFKAGNPRIGIIGVGGRGTSLLENLLAADAQILAICDIVREKAEHAQGMVTKTGQKAPELYTNGDHAFEALVARATLSFLPVSEA